MIDEKCQKLYHSITNISDAWLTEAQTVKIRKRNRQLRWTAAAACACLACVLAVTLPAIRRVPRISDDSRPYGQTIGQGTGDKDREPAPQSAAGEDPLSGTAGDSSTVTGTQEAPVSVASLIGEEEGYHELLLQTTVFPIGKYTGTYEKVLSAKSGSLSENRGGLVPDTTEWYFVSGHTDLQYLIREEDGEFSLWKFSCFDSDSYPYLDVLKLVYRIDSADDIRGITVRPADMDNTDGGKKIQREIGTHAISDREKIDSLYQVLTTLTCHGSDHWDMIDYGFEDAATDKADGGISHQAVRLGRYLTITTDYGNEIDGLKYTAVSDMFYEYSGIAYEPLSTEQAELVRDILKIKIS